ncbi:hypothetical protein VP01_2122g5 [Puccinia sorghi]|uniref:Uncharacterized protein n=1 Tax=Puccinia sorghi TaxID=27349 RepID=A0A0L6VBT2_9BASI|nr:hypothetical protein VP01_2122g5 [Puccinia sorghi]
MSTAGRAWRNKSQEMENELPNFPEPAKISKNLFEDPQGIPSPPNGIFSDPEVLKTSIKDFSWEHGYAIFLKRSVSGKIMIFKREQRQSQPQNYLLDQL